MDAVLKCIDQKITALQIHDGVLVKHTRASEASQIMADTFEEHTRQQTMVTTTGVRLRPKPRISVPQ